MSASGQKPDILKDFQTAFIHSKSRVRLRCLPTAAPPDEDVRPEDLTDVRPLKVDLGPGAGASS